MRKLDVFAIYEWKTKTETANCLKSKYDIRKVIMFCLANGGKTYFFNKNSFYENHFDGQIFPN